MSKTIDIYRPEDGAYVTASGLLPDGAYLHSTFGVPLVDSMAWHWHMDGDHFAEASKVLAAYGLNMTVTDDATKAELVSEDWEARAFNQGMGYGIRQKLGGLGEQESPLSGEYADDVTLDEVYASIGWPEQWDDDSNSIPDAWERGYRQAHAGPAIVLTW